MRGWLSIVALEHVRVLATKDVSELHLTARAPLTPESALTLILGGTESGSSPMPR